MSRICSVILDTGILPFISSAQHEQQCTHVLHSTTDHHLVTCCLNKLKISKYISTDIVGGQDIVQKSSPIEVPS